MKRVYYSGEIYKRNFYGNVTLYTNNPNDGLESQVQAVLEQLKIAGDEIISDVGEPVFTAYTWEVNWDE